MITVKRYASSRGGLQRRLGHADDGSGGALAGAGEPGVAEAGDDVAVDALCLAALHLGEDARCAVDLVDVRLDGGGEVLGVARGHGRPGAGDRPGRCEHGGGHRLARVRVEDPDVAHRDSPHRREGVS